MNFEWQTITSNPSSLTVELSPETAKAVRRMIVEPDIKWTFDIVGVIYHAPATIVFWKDGTKTVVKCQEGDTFSKEKGLAMCIAKKAFGNKGSYNDVFKKWCD